MNTRQPTITVLRGECVATMRTLAANSVDAIVTDPPYELGFMGKSWDSAGVSYDPATWAEALRVLRPGGHLLAFGGSRTYHRIAVAIEDAGFEIRDSLMWIYGSGFPKSLDVSKALDKKAGAQRTAIPNPLATQQTASKGRGATITVEGGDYKHRTHIEPTPVTDEAKRWEGWGTALKPSHEPIVLARKPLIGTVAENVLAHGTGALNIDASRIGDEVVSVHNAPKGTFAGGEADRGSDTDSYRTHVGRWPANTLWDEEAAAMLDASTPAQPSRFFYVAKPGKKERDAGLDGFPEGPAFDNPSGTMGNSMGSKSGFRANVHPTVKPIALMRYLVRLITPPGGTVLDPFLGSGTTACAAALEGFDCIGIEMNADYANIAEARIEHWKKERR